MTLLNTDNRMTDVLEGSTELVRSRDANLGKKGSVTYMAAERMAIQTIGDRSADSVARVLQENGLALR